MQAVSNLLQFMIFFPFHLAPDFLILIVAQTALAACRIDIFSVWDAIGKLLNNFLMSFGDFCFFQVHVGVHQLPPHLQVVTNPIPCDPLISHEAEKGALHCVDLWDSQFLEYYASGSCLITPPEPTVLELEPIVVLADKSGVNFSELGVVHQRITIKKTTQLFRVRMQIEDERNIILIQGDHLLQPTDHWGQSLQGLLPHPVGVNARQLRSGVPMDDPVHVDHRHDLEHNAVDDVFQLFGGGRVEGNQILDDAVCHITGSDLPGVLPTEDPHDFAVLESPLSGGNSEDVDGVPTDSLSDGLEGDNMGNGLIEHDGVVVCEQLGMCIGVGGGKVDGVGFPEVVLEGEGVVVLALAPVVFLPDPIGEVVDLLSVPGPTHPMLVVVLL